MKGGETFRVEVPGGLLRGERRPGDEPPLLFLHAGVCDGRSWEQLFDFLAGHELISYDRRGHGQSTRSMEPFSHLDDLIAVLAHLEVRRAWLVGSSMGGGLAVQAALEHPEVVQGLVLLAPAVFGAPDLPPDPATSALGDRIYAAIDKRDNAVAVRMSTWLWLDGPAGPEGRVSGRARELLADMYGTVLANRTDEVAEGALGDNLAQWDRLGEINVPVAIACGELDLPGILQRSQEAAQKIPHATYQALSGMAHLPYLEQPQVVADIIQAAMPSSR